MLLKAAARKLSIPDLLRMLDEKLDEECSRPLSLALSSELLESEVCYDIVPAEQLRDLIGIPGVQIKSLETRAQDIQKLINTLRNTLRSLSPSVNRLPPEIISYVARCVLGEDDVDAISIVPLTHVCRYWRDSIISAPKNWTLIYGERVKLAKLSLERAKAAPLAVHVSLDRSRRRRGFLDFLQPHLQNVVSFTCINFFNVGELAKVLNIPNSMPNLRSLSLTRPRGAEESQLVDAFDFSTHAALRELSLYNIPIVPSILTLSTLTDFSLFDHHFGLHIDLLLNFLEGNRSLESASLTIRFAEPSLCCSRRKGPVRNPLQHLSVSSDDAGNIRALISGIALRRGGHLEIHHAGNNAGLTRILSGVSRLTHIQNLSSPVLMEYGPFPRSIRLLAPDGSFSYKGPVTTESPFGEFPLLPLANVRELRLECRGSWILRQFRLSSFPSLEVLAVDGGSKVSLLSPVLPDHASSPSLQTLALLDCVITEDFMAQLAQVAFDRTNHNSTSLGRVVIINSEGDLPAAASVERLRKFVSVVEVLEGDEFPKDLS